MTNNTLNNMSNIILNKLTDVKIIDVVKPIDNNSDIKILNLNYVVGITITNILDISTTNTNTNININTNNDNDKTIEIFINNMSIAVERFCKFLDYDGDGVIEIVKRNEKGEIIKGEDIEKIENDVNKFVSGFTNNNVNTNVNKTVNKTAIIYPDPQKAVIAALSSLAMYYTNDNISSSREDFAAFRDACLNSYASIINLKNVNYKNIIHNNAEDLMKFIITLCVILIPIIDALNNKIKTEKNITDIILTKEDMNKIVFNMYGLDIDFILISIDNLVKIFLDIYKASSKTKTYTKTYAKKYNLFCCIKS